MLAANRAQKIDKNELSRRQKQTYHCEICDKTVRNVIRYHHVRTMKHLRLQEEVDKKMAELQREEEAAAAAAEEAT
jgi:hypothetical protein